MAADHDEQNHTITVVEKCKVGLVPDIGRVSIGADAMGDTVSGANTDVETWAAAIVAEPEQMGIESSSA